MVVLGSGLSRRQPPQSESAGYRGTTMGSGLVRGIVSEWEGRIEAGNLRGYNERPLRKTPSGEIRIT